LRRPLEPWQYLAIRYTERLAEAGAVTSVGSRGDSYDNALAESTIGLYKTELIGRRGPWRNLDDVELATLEWSTGTTTDACTAPATTDPPPSTKPPSPLPYQHRSRPEPQQPASTEPGAVHGKVTILVTGLDLTGTPRARHALNPPQTS